MIKATAKWDEDFRLTVDNSRGHSVVCDLPVSSGGGDRGPTALELAVMALAGCAVTIFLDVCRHSKIKLDKFEVVTEAEKKSGTPEMAKVKIKAKASSKARRKLLEAAWRRTEANCPVLLIYRGSVPIDVEFEAIVE